MEFKKSIKRKHHIFWALIVLVCFLLGYFLLASLDGIPKPTIEELYFSIYTVYTEFGMLIFPVLILQAFYLDYKNKNIMFYKLLGYNSSSYFLHKILVEFVMLSVPTTVGVICVGIIYEDFANLVYMIISFEFVIFFQVMINCFWGFLIRNMVVAYVVNFAYWLISIMMCTANQNFAFLARYDAANPVYDDFRSFLTENYVRNLHLAGNILYSVVLFGIIFVLMFLFRKRWEKNGI